jgi:ankyrin repeat protein
MPSVFDQLAGGDLDGVEAALTADPSLAAIRHSSGSSLLAWAYYVGKPQAVPLIRRHVPELDPYDAIIVDDMEAVRAHLAAGWDGNALAPDGFTPLGLAAFFGRAEIFDLLLPLADDLDAQAQNSQQVAAIHAATATRNAAMVERLLRAGARPDLPQARGFTALHVAAQHGDTPIVALLLLFGADPRLKNAKGSDAIDHAREGGHDWLAQLLEKRL